MCMVEMIFLTIALMQVLVTETKCTCKSVKSEFTARRFSLQFVSLPWYFFNTRPGFVDCIYFSTPVLRLLFSYIDYTSFLKQFKFNTCFLLLKVDAVLSFYTWLIFFYDSYLFVMYLSNTYFPRC